MFETASQTVYLVGYVSVLQTINNNESIRTNVFNPEIESDVAAATIKTSMLWIIENYMLKNKKIAI